MPHHPNLHIAMEESHLLEENQLGVPLSIYRLKAKDISHTRFHSWIMLIWWLTSFLFVPCIGTQYLRSLPNNNPAFSNSYNCPILISCSLSRWVWVDVCSFCGCFSC